MPACEGMKEGAESGSILEGSLTLLSSSLAFHVAVRGLCGLIIYAVLVSGTFSDAVLFEECCQLFVGQILSCGHFLKSFDPCLSRLVSCMEACTCGKGTKVTTLN